MWAMGAIRCTPCSFSTRTRYSKNEPGRRRRSLTASTSGAPPLQQLPDARGGRVVNLLSYAQGGLGVADGLLAAAEGFEREGELVVGRGRALSIPQSAGNGQLLLAVFDGPPYSAHFVGELA